MLGVCLKVVVVLLFATVAGAQNKPGSVLEKSQPTATAANDSSSRLPVKRVVLYKNGIGYFEHTARVRGNQDLAIDFTTGQLNDVLKSLTVVDLGEGRISGVRYNSTAPLDERLKALRLPFGEQVTRADFLMALRGARVEVHSGSATTTGRLLSVEKERKANGKGDFYDVTEFSIVSDTGEMKNFDLGPGTSVRLAERDLGDEIGRYLNLVGSSRARDLRRMTISATGTGDRDIFVSYISEVPIWKSTYRIILPDKPGEKPLLQGWAIVDNTVGDDWKDVQLSLVAAAPQSFIQDISQPYYARRPVVALPESMMLSPQTHEAAMNVPGPSPPPSFAGGTGGLQGTVTDPSGAFVAGARVTIRNEESGSSQTAVTDSSGTYHLYNVPAGNSALFVDAPGFQRYSLSNFYLGVGRTNEIHATLQLGTASETVEVRAEPATIQTQSSMVSSAMRKQGAEAEGKDVGEMFEYDIKQKITIGKNQSALVPILQSHIDVEKVSLWSASDNDSDDSNDEKPSRALRALWVTNSSGLTLDSGTFNILEGDTFAGEGLIDTVNPGERRLLSYATDTAVHVVAHQESSEKPVSHVRIAKGIMVLTKEERDILRYTIRNADTLPRQVVIEHPFREGWKLAEGPKAEETSASFYRFRVSVEAGKTAELPVEEYHPLDTSYQLNNLNNDQVVLLTQQGRMTPALQDVFRRVLDQQNQVGALATQLQSHQQEVESITKDQVRLRENMKALKGSAEEKALLQRYTHQLDSQEDRLNTLNKEISDLQEKHTQAQQLLDRMVQEITLDERF
ncbi:MAG: carboxypeptidase regulatory-like domain-containing protein [Acidobacteriia bacterium]|nr:carboxypeptidase regulatory-like domain-containing protein [Terriglobia bacterium]